MTRPRPAVLVVTGASGAGKTTLVRRLAALGLSGVGCYEFDTIGIPSEAEIAARFGDGAGFQAWALDEWMARLVRNEDGVRVAVLDAQVRPRAARDALAAHGVERGAVLLVDCDYAERNARLRGSRGQRRRRHARSRRRATSPTGGAPSDPARMADVPKLPPSPWVNRYRSTKCPSFARSIRE